MTIDTNLSAEDAAVLDALHAPMLINLRGELFVLRSDGATLRVPGHLSPERGRFFRPASQGVHKWVASNRQLYVLQHGRKPYVLRFDASSLSPTRIVPQYSPVFQMSAARGWIGVSTAEGLAAIDAGAPDVHWRGLHSQFQGYCAWDDEGQIQVGGMQAPRQTLKQGGCRRMRAAILGVSPSMAPDHAPQVDLAPYGYAVADLAGVYPGWASIQPRVECWLHAQALGDGATLLVGGMVDDARFEDSEMLTPLPDNTDFDLVGIFMREHGRMTVGRALYPFGFWQAIDVGSGARLYLQDVGVSRSGTVLDARVLSVSGQGELAEPQPMRVAGLDTSLRISFMDLHHDDALGYYGSISVARTFASHDSFLIRSDDGVNWVVVHSLDEAASSGAKG